MSESHEPAAGEPLFTAADLIHSYTRADAIADGVLVDMSDGWAGQMAREAGIRIPVAVTAAVFERYVALTPAAKAMCNDEQGRWWDICWMFRHAAVRAANSDTVRFQLHVVSARRRATLTTLKAVIGGGDNGEPVITIMLPEED